MEYTGSLTYVEMWNHFDEWGTALALPRITAETIPDYRTRIKDVMLHRGGAAHTALFYGINRDFGLEVYHDALILKSAKNADGTPVLDDLTVAVRADGIYVSSAAFRVIRGAEIIPSDTLRVRLVNKNVLADILVEYPIGTHLSHDKFTFDWDRNEVVFNDQDLAGLTITLSYLYYEVVPTRGQTLTQVAAALNAIRTPGGVQAIVATLHDDVPVAMSAEGIPLTPSTFIDDIHYTSTGEYMEMYRLPCGEASLRALNDPEFIKSEMGAGDTYFDTKLIRWVEQARNITKFGWENLVFDETRINDDLGLAVVPTLADPKTTSWAPRNPLHTDDYDTIEAEYRSYLSTGDLTLKRVGFPQLYLQSGVGGRDDLKVVVEEGTEGLTFSPTVYDFFPTPTGEATLTGDALSSATEGF